MAPRLGLLKVRAVALTLVASPPLRRLEGLACHGPVTETGRQGLVTVATVPVVQGRLLRPPTPQEGRRVGRHIAEGKVLLAAGLATGLPTRPRRLAGLPPQTVETRRRVGRPAVEITAVRLVRPDELVAMPTPDTGIGALGTGLPLFLGQAPRPVGEPVGQTGGMVVVMPLVTLP